MKIALVSAWGLNELHQETPEMNLARELATMGESVSCFSYAKGGVGKRREQTRGSRIAIFSFDYAFRRIGGSRAILPNPSRLSRTVSTILSHQTDVWHFHHPSSLTIATCPALQLRHRSPTVFTTHDPLFATGVRSVLSSKGIGYFMRKSDWWELPELILRSVPYNLADKIVALSNFERNVLIRNGLRQEKIVVMPNGANPIPRLNGIREKLGLPEKPLILTVARFVKQKGHRYLIEAIPTVLRHVDAHFLMIGRDNRLLPELMAQAERLNVGRNVTFMTSVDEEVLARAYNDCDVFVLPSLYESFGLSSLEAMSCGKPVVATEWGGTRETIDNMKDGIIVPVADPGALASAILMLLGSKLLAESIGRAAAEKVALKFTWSRIAAETRAIYESVLHR